MSLRVYNYLTRQKENFVPLVEGEVKMYVCGPTVYDHSHLGHAKTYVAFDVINRHLRFSGYKVRYVQNITDVGHLLDDGEDRVLKKSGTLGIEPMEVVETYTRSYFEDMDALGVVRPDISPRASGHVPEQIAMTQTLIEMGHAYVAETGDVYFDVASYPEYGKLSGQKLDQLIEGARVEVVEGKRSPVDFALWRAADDSHIMQWDSPWGRGFPGWHIECSAMANKYLGQTFDIHGGGLENRFPHNECEIAQSEAVHGETFLSLLAVRRIAAGGWRQDEQVARQLHDDQGCAETKHARSSAHVPADEPLSQPGGLHRRSGRGSVQRLGTADRCGWVGTSPAGNRPRHRRC